MSDQTKVYFLDVISFFYPFYYNSLLKKLKNKLDNNDNFILTT